MPIAGTNFGWGSSAATPSRGAAWVSGGSPNQQTLLAVAVPALFVAVPILAGVTVAVAMAVTVAMSMVVMSIPIPVPMFIVSASMSMGSMAVTVLVVTITVTVAVAVAVTVTIRVTVLVITVAGLTAARPILAPLVAVALHASRDGYAPLFGVDRVHASVEHARGEVPTPVLTGGRCVAVPRSAFHRDRSRQCQPGFHVAFPSKLKRLRRQVTIRPRHTDPHRAARWRRLLASLFAGRRVAVLFKHTRHIHLPERAHTQVASPAPGSMQAAVEAVLEHRGGGKLTPILTGDAVLRDALGKRFPSSLMQAASSPPGSVHRGTPRAPRRPRAYSGPHRSVAESQFSAMQSASASRAIAAQRFSSPPLPPAPSSPPAPVLGWRPPSSMHRS